MGINANLDEMTEDEKNFYYFKVCIESKIEKKIPQIDKIVFQAQ